VNLPTSDDSHGWLSGPCGPAETPAQLLDRLRAEHPAWTVTAHPLGLGLWTAERHQGTALRYIVAMTGAELATKLDAADDEGNPR
jgi:hypothetical protein